MNNKFAVGMLVIMLLFTGLSGYLSYSYLKKNNQAEEVQKKIQNSDQKQSAGGNTDDSFKWVMA